MMNFRDFWGRLDDRMGREVDASGVGWVRLVIGATLLTSISYSWYLGEIYDRYIDPVFYFKYPFFPFVMRMSGYVPYGIFTLLLLLGFAFFLGWQARWTAKILALLATYVFLQDATMYSDHEYMMIVFLLLLGWIPANRWFSSDRLTGRETRSTVPFWTLWLLRIQVSLILFFSGTNKFTPDWLVGAPIAEWLTVEGGNWGAFESIRLHPSLAPAIGWGTALFETGAGILLWNGFAARILVPVLVLYSLVDSLFVGMGVSPLTGLLCVVFLSPGFPRSVFNRISPHLDRIPGGKIVWRFLCAAGKIADRVVCWFDETPVVGKRTVTPSADAGTVRSETPLWLVSEWTKYAFMLWILIQIVVPFRWVAYAGNKDWAEYTSRFSWRGSIRDKTGQATFTITLAQQELLWTIEPEGDFPIPLAVLYPPQELQSRGLSEGMLRDIVGTPRELIEQRIKGFGFTEESLDRLFAAHERFLDLQLSAGHAEIMTLEPELVRQYAHEVARVVNEVTSDQVEVHVQLQESINSRPFSVCIPSTVELSRIPNAAALWPSIEPLKQPLPSLELRMAGARQVLAQRELEREMALRTMGLARPAEPKKSPAISDEADRLLNAEFAELLE